jgi:hypothetical protein
MLGGIRRGVAEVILFEVTKDGAGLETLQVRERVFGMERLDAGKEESGSNE